MILEIALGIVLAVFILALLPFLVVLGAIAVVLAAVIGLAALAVLWSQGMDPVTLFAWAAAIGGFIGFLVLAVIQERWTGLAPADVVAGSILGAVVLLALASTLQEVAAGDTTHLFSYLLGWAAGALVLYMFARHVVRTVRMHRAKLAVETPKSITK